MIITIEGLPAEGKSTLARKMFSDSKRKEISEDQVCRLDEWEDISGEEVECLIVEEITDMRLVRKSLRSVEKLNHLFRMPKNIILVTQTKA